MLHRLWRMAKVFPPFWLLYWFGLFIVDVRRDLTHLAFVVRLAPAAYRKVREDRRTETDDPFHPSLESRGFIYLFPGFVQDWYWADLTKRRIKAAKRGGCCC